MCFFYLEINPVSFGMQLLSHCLCVVAPMSIKFFKLFYAVWVWLPHATQRPVWYFGSCFYGKFLKSLAHFFGSVLLINSLRLSMEFYVASYTGLRDAFLHISSLRYFSHTFQLSKPFLVMPLAGKWSSLRILGFHTEDFNVIEVFKTKWWEKR